MQRILLLHAMLTLTCAVALGEDLVRLEALPPPHVEFVAPSASDIELERLLSSTKEKRARVSDVFRFNFSHRHLIGDVYLGAHGELFGGPHQKLTVPASLLYYAYRGGLLLVPLSDFPELGLDAARIYAYVSPAGHIIYTVTNEEAPADLSSRPNYWPAPDDVLPPRPLRPGELLFRPTPGSHPRDYPPPEGSTSWAFQALSGTLVAPMPEDARPENVVWVIPEADGGFRLVYGGPKRHGELMMAVSPSHEVTLGPNSLYTLQSREGRDKQWIFSGEHGPIMIPPGYSVSPLTDGTLRFWQSSDGSIHREVARYF